MLNKAVAVRSHSRTEADCHGTRNTQHDSSMPDAPAPKGWGVWLRNKFLAGLALALPLIITFWILYSIYDLLHGWSKPVLAQVVNS
jgi:hypothetical protein